MRNRNLLLKSENSCNFVRRTLPFKFQNEKNLYTFSFKITIIHQAFLHYLPQSFIKSHKIFPEPHFVVFVEFDFLLDFC